MHGTWLKYLSDLGEDKNKIDLETDRRIAAYKEDQADYFAGLFVNYCIQKGILHPSAVEFVLRLYGEIGSDKDITRALRSHSATKTLSRRTPGSSSHQGGHAEGIFRSELIKHTVNVDDTNFVELARYGVLESWK